MSQHTPGPWTFYTEPQPNGCPIVGAKGLMVCMLAHTINQEDQREVALANSHLISAAPELLYSLKETLLFCETFSNRWDGQTGAHPFGMVNRARAAIAKATGQ